MSHALTLARPYARAAFGLAREHGRLADWSQLLATSAGIAADSRVHRLLGHPGMSTDGKVALVKPESLVDPLYTDFLATLAENHRLALLPEISGLFDALRADEEKVLRARVTSAKALDAGELDGIKAALKRRFGREVEVDTAVDEALIGGAIIDAGDMVIDGSVRGKLARLQSALSH